jgi:hypothetical protein
MKGRMLYRKIFFFFNFCVKERKRVKGRERGSVQKCKEVHISSSIKNNKLLLLKIKLSSVLCDEQRRVQSVVCTTSNFYNLKTI